MTKSNDARIIYTMRVKAVTKEKLDRLKRFNPDISWDLILLPITNQVSLPKPQSKNTTPPPTIELEVNYSI